MIKLSDNFDQKIYMRSMKYMTALDENGNEYVEIYKPETFVSVEEFFKKATYIGQTVVDKSGKQYAILYRTNQLLINYNIDSKEYEVLNTKLLNGNLSISDLKISDNIEKNPFTIIRAMLNVQLEHEKDYNMDLIMQELQKLVTSTPLEYTEDEVRACNHSSFDDYLASLGMNKDEYLSYMREVKLAYSQNDLTKVEELLTQLTGGGR